MDEDKNPQNNPDEAGTIEEPKGNDEPKDAPQAPSQEPKKFSKRDRLLYAQEKIEKQLEELENEDENRPLTVGEFKRLQRENTRETALELANDIKDPDERAEVVKLLEKHINPSGDPKADLELARSAANAVKNARIAEELARKGNASGHSSAPGSPGKTQDEFKPTDDELVFMRPPYNLKKEDILASRQRSREKE